VIAFGVALCRGKLTLMHQSLLERSDEIWPQLRIPGSVQTENENENETNHWRTRKAMVMDKTGMSYRWANKSTILTDETGVKHESIGKVVVSLLINIVLCRSFFCKIEICLMRKFVFYFFV
jgi:hypothetical protein